MEFIEFRGEGGEAAAEDVSFYSGEIYSTVDISFH